MDKLDTIFKMQQSLDEDIVKRRQLCGIEMHEWIQKDVLAIISELGELLDEVNFKWWKNTKPIDYDALHEEMVDILHFFVSMCIRAGLDADMLYNIYVGKNEENFKRQQGLSKKPGYSANKTV